MLRPDRPGQAPSRNLQRTEQQDRAGDQLGESRQLRGQLHISHDQRLNEERWTACATLHERFELLDVVGRNNFAEPGDDEHGAERGLDERTSGQCGVAALWQAWLGSNVLHVDLAFAVIVPRMPAVA